jgi:hypothetical protein
MRNIQIFFGYPEQILGQPLIPYSYCALATQENLVETRAKPRFPQGDERWLQSTWSAHKKHRSPSSVFATPENLVVDSSEAVATIHVVSS